MYRFCHMCTAYKVGNKKGSNSGFPRAKWTDSDFGPERLMRPTQPGPVVMSDRSLVTMRWGFERNWSKAIVNAREDKLDGIWKEAFHERRCLIPATAYYEWSGPAGRKQAHEFTSQDDSMLWIAGIWEKHPNHGLCYNMITTTPNKFITQYHSRMPAILTHAQLTPFLDGNIATFHPPEDLLEAQDVLSPLKKDSQQQELF